MVAECVLPQGVRESKKYRKADKQRLGTVACGGYDGGAPKTLSTKHMSTKLWIND
jgi:hypothetical protein